jgi:hypothetical protein
MTTVQGHHTTVIGTADLVQDGFTERLRKVAVPSSFKMSDNRRTARRTATRQATTEVLEATTSSLL